MAAIVDGEQVDWMQRGVTSIIVASRSADNRPALAQGLGCHWSDDRRHLRVFLLEGQSHDVVAHLRGGRDVSVLFTQSATTRALQLKSGSAREVPVATDDAARLDAYRENLAKEWGQYGQPPGFAAALMSRSADTLVAFELEPAAAFDQTPGPRAGAQVGGGS